MFDIENVYCELETRLEEATELNQKFFNFVSDKGLLGDFRQWETKSRGIPTWQ